MNLAQALTADRISILRPAAYSAGEPAGLNTVFKDGIAYLADYPPARFHFVRLPDETIAIQTPRGEARCFGKYGYGGSYFVVAAAISWWRQMMRCGCIRRVPKTLGSRNGYWLTAA